jgi:hypothetical protein
VSNDLGKVPTNLHRWRLLRERSRRGELAWGTLLAAPMLLAATFSVGIEMGRWRTKLVHTMPDAYAATGPSHAYEARVKGIVALQREVHRIAERLQQLAADADTRVAAHAQVALQSGREALR